MPRESHADWTPPRQGRDPVEILEHSNRGRLPELVPIRYGRMVRSPFTFLRGSAALMAHDLATTPTTGVQVQACGDCHLLNFGVFATPERNLVFDLNDFDETLPAPWEWDLKRLVVSFLIAARDNRLSDDDGHARGPGVRARLSGAPARVLAHEAAGGLVPAAGRGNADQGGARCQGDEGSGSRSPTGRASASSRISSPRSRRWSTDATGWSTSRRFCFMWPSRTSRQRVHEALADYRESLSDERRVLLDRYRLEDCALKVVGIGSVGTRCYIGLLFSEDGHPLILQFKEAVRSVLEPYAGEERVRQPGPARRRGTAADAVVQRHLPGLGARTARATISTCASCAT